ncbi:I78 family peptidase inhibitor [Aerolutibacter ruishenii]|uniref:Peptidase inhibitor I78 family protein n=1 Tax=Aerolutibacter ruishenii TaxID=686800 RepID=A0A562M0V5_9GAMM|nr:I78 family peptidase inhibitor [Lysobacter ruishenii]TWI13483.1 peptidase inhibitor I78 family protein [Lysobacter ruishenii]
MASPRTADTRLPLVPLAVLLASMVACSTMPAEPPMDAPPVGVCNAQAASWAIGRAPTQDVVDRATRDSGAKLSRVLRPGQVVTMEYRAERLNIDVNEREAITGLRCG